MNGYMHVVEYSTVNDVLVELAALCDNTLFQMVVISHSITVNTSVDKRQRVEYCTARSRGD